MPTERPYFLDCVADELELARDSHPPINSAHEGYSVILEELQEFWAQVKRKRSERDPDAMWAELVQVAAMAARTAEDVLVWDWERKNQHVDIYRIDDPVLLRQRGGGPEREGVITEMHGCVGVGDLEHVVLQIEITTQHRK
jgi:hypothetical protein